MIILKFGGTSVSSKERIRTISEIVKRDLDRQPVLVVSAFKGVTDLLISALSANKKERKEILKRLQDLHMGLIAGEKNELVMKAYVKNTLKDIESLLDRTDVTKATTDRVISYGEIMSSFIISELLKESGISAQQIISTELIVTNDHFTNAEFLPEKTKENVKKLLVPLVKKGVVPVVTGFIGATEKGRVTTLGRGGSDYSAAILGYSLDSEEVQIWTDVDGIYTADPAYISSARLLERITYKEASELAAFGAKVLHPRTIRPLTQKNIPVVVRNTFNPNSTGTYINGKSVGMPRITAVASKPKVTLVNLYSADMLLSKGFLQKVFSIFAKHHISVDLVSVSEVSVSVTLDNRDELKDALAELGEFSTTSTNQVGVVSLIGENILETDGVLKNVFTVLNHAKIPVRMLSLGASDINISIVTDVEAVYPAVKLLHKSMVERRKQ